MNDALIKDFISQLGSLTNRIWQIGDLLAASELHEWAREQRKVAECLGVVIAGLNGCVGGMELAEEKPSLDARLKWLEMTLIKHDHGSYLKRISKLEQDFETFRQAFIQSLEADKKYLKYQAGFKEL